jgi:sugar lactone lactonase YvrE
MSIVSASMMLLTTFAAGQVSPATQANQPAKHPAFQKVELVAQMVQTPGNVAVSPTGRIFASLHPFGNPKPRVVEVFAGTNEGRDYPNAAWSKSVGRDGVGIQAIIGLRCGADGVLWMLDVGGNGVAPKLVAWDTTTEQLKQVIHLPEPATTPTSFVQDLALDPARGKIYIADCGLGDLSTPPAPAIIVVDTKTGTSRRVLDRHATLMPEAEAKMEIDGVEVRALSPDGTPFPPRVGINPITIDPQFEYVYWGSMHGTRVYRIRASMLANPDMNNDQLVGAIEEYGRKGVSDGISIDSAGNVYVTDVAHNAIGVLEATPDATGVRPYRLLAQDADLLSWPDGMSVGPDGWLYVVVNQLHRHAALNAGNQATKPPFAIVKLKPLAGSTMGR